MINFQSHGVFNAWKSSKSPIIKEIKIILDMGLFRQGYPVSFWPIILTDKNEIMASLNANFDHISLHFKLTFLHNTVKDEFLYQGIGITEKNQFNVWGVQGLKQLKDLWSTFDFLTKWQMLPLDSAETALEHWVNDKINLILKQSS